MYKELADNILKTISYNKETTDLSLMPVGNTLLLKSNGVFIIENGRPTRLDSMKVKVNLLYNDIYENFIKLMNWTKPTINKTELEMISAQLSCSVVSGIMNSNVEINKNFKLNGIPTLQNDVATICFGYTYRLINDVIAYNRIETSDKNMNVINNIFIQADQLYSDNTKYTQYVMQFISQYLGMFLNNFIIKFISIIPVSVNNNPIDIQVGNIKNTIFKVKKAIISATHGGVSNISYMNMTEYLIKILYELGLYQTLVNDIYKYQYPYKDIYNMFDYSQEDLFINNIVNEAINYFKERFNKLESKNIRVSNNIKLYEELVKKEINDFMNDIQRYKLYNVRYYYEHGKKIMIISNSNNSNEACVNLVALWNKLINHYKNYISDNVPQNMSTDKYLNSYLSVISKVKLEILKSPNGDIVEFRYITPYIDNYSGEIQWM